MSHLRVQPYRPDSTPEQASFGPLPARTQTRTEIALNLLVRYTPNERKTFWICGGYSISVRA